jgi:hypothetical protein
LIRTPGALVCSAKPTYIYQVIGLSTNMTDNNDARARNALGQFSTTEGEGESGLGEPVGQFSVQTPGLAGTGVAPLGGAAAESEPDDFVDANDGDDQKGGAGNVGADGPGAAAVKKVKVEPGGQDGGAIFVSPAAASVAAEAAALAEQRRLIEKESAALDAAYAELQAKRARAAGGGLGGGGTMVDGRGVVAVGAWGRWRGRPRSHAPSRHLLTTCRTRTPSIV